MRGSRYLLITLFLVAAIPLMGQRVGLVMSGGGAKGLYHIGVLKALEENDIPIDYITGTSMGAIIGGLYAVGLTPDSIAKIFVSPQVQYWTTGTIALRYQYYFKQMRRNAAMVNIRWQPGGGSASITRSSLIQSDQLDLAFIDFFATATVASGGDFDRLFVPFRCMASDIAGRRPVELSSGDLGQAIRASMSIPLVFSPVVMSDSTRLYDGGLFDNFPWNVMERDFNPDVVIGSKCVPSARNLSSTNIGEQLFSLTMLSTDYTLPEGRSIMVERILDDVSTMDFGKAKEVIDLGYKDAMAQMGAIKQLIARRVDADSLAQRRREFRERKPELLFGRLEISGLDDNQVRYVNNMLGLKESRTFTLEEFNAQYFKILAEGAISSDFPTVTYDPYNRLFTLRMNMRTRPSMKIMLGGNISSTAMNQAYIGLEYRNIGRSSHTWWLDGYFSPFYTSTTLGLRTDFFLGRLPLYYETAASYNRYNFFRSNFGYIAPIYDLTYVIHNDYFATFALGTPLARQVVANLRFNSAHNDYLYYLNRYYHDTDPMDHTRFQFLGLKYEIERNSIPNAYAITGLHQTLSAIAITGKEYTFPADPLQPKTGPIRRKWVGARFKREDYMKFTDNGRFTFGYLIDGVLTSHPKFSNDYATNLSSPSFTPTPHSRMIYMNEFRAPSYVAAGVIPSVEFMPNFYLKMSAYAFLPAYYDRIVNNVRQRLRYIFDGTLVYQTYIGPASLSLSKYDISRNNWFLTFNFGFAIFNSKGTFY